MLKPYYYSNRQPITFQEIVQVSTGKRPSINLDRDKNDEEKVEGYIPTPTAIELLVQLSTAISGENLNNRTRYLYGPYGGGKSHLALMLMYLMKCGPNSPAMSPIWQKVRGLGPKGHSLIKEIIDNWERLDTTKGFFPVIVQAYDGPFRQAMLTALNRSLERVFGRNALTDLNLTSIYLEAIKQIDLWNLQHHELYVRLEDALDRDHDLNLYQLKNDLKSFKHSSYEIFLDAYHSVTGGGIFNPGSLTKTSDYYAEATLRLKEKGYAGIFVIHDEFGDYLSATIRNEVEGTSRNGRPDGQEFQEFAEKCVENEQLQIHYLMCSHLDVGGYAERTRADSEVKQTWEKYFGRVQKTLITSLGGDKEIYQLIDSVLVQEPESWEAFLEAGAAKRIELVSKTARQLEYFPAKDWELAKVEEIVVGGCYPLHPAALYALPRLSILLGQNERTMFTFISNADIGTLGAYMDGQPAFLPENAPMFPADSLFDYFLPAVTTTRPKIKDWYNASLYKLGGASAPALDVRLLKLLVLWQVMQEGTVLPLTLDRAAFALDLAKSEELQLSVQRLEEKHLIFVSRDKILNVYSSANSIEDEILEQIKLLRPNHKSGDFLKRKNGQLMSASLRIEDVNPVSYLREVGVNRYFKSSLISPSDLWSNFATSSKVRSIRNADPIQQLISVIDSEADGLVLYVLAQTYDEISAFKRQVSIHGPLVNPRIIVVIPNKPLPVYDKTLRLEALLKLLGETDTTKQERRTLLLKKVEEVVQDLEELLNPLLQFSQGEAGAEVWCNGAKLSKVFNSPADLEITVNEILRKTFLYEIPVRDETFGQRKVTTATTKTRRPVIRDILEFDSFVDSRKENFGYSVSSAERRLLRTVLVAHKILKPVSGKWELSLPTNAEESNLLYVLELIANFFLSSDGVKKPVVSFIQKLTSPPFGLFTTVLPVYISVAIAKQAHQLRIFHKNKLITKDLADAIQDLVENPDEYEVIWYEVEPEKRAFLKMVIQELDRDTYFRKEVSFQTLNDALANAFSKLSLYARQTREKLIPNSVKFREVMEMVAKVSYNEGAHTVDSQYLLQKLIESLDAGSEFSQLSTTFTQASLKLRSVLAQFEQIDQLLLGDLSGLLKKELLGLTKLDERVSDASLIEGFNHYAQTRDPQQLEMYVQKVDGINCLVSAVSKSTSITQILTLLVEGIYKKSVTSLNDAEVTELRLNLVQYFILLKTIGEKIVVASPPTLPPATQLPQQLFDSLPFNGVVTGTTSNNTNTVTKNTEYQVHESEVKDAYRIKEEAPTPLYLDPLFLRSVLAATKPEVNLQEGEEVSVDQVMAALVEMYQNLPRITKVTATLLDDKQQHNQSLVFVRNLLRAAANGNSSADKILQDLSSSLRLAELGNAHEVVKKAKIDEAGRILRYNLRNLLKVKDNKAKKINLFAVEALARLVDLSSPISVDQLLPALTNYLANRDPDKLKNFNEYGAEEIKGFLQLIQKVESTTALVEGLQRPLVGKPLSFWNDGDIQSFEDKINYIVNILKSIPQKAPEDHKRAKLSVSLNGNSAWLVTPVYRLDEIKEKEITQDLIDMLIKHELFNREGMYPLTIVMQKVFRFLEKLDSSK